MKVPSNSHTEKRTSVKSFTYRKVALYLIYLLKRKKIEAVPLYHTRMLEEYIIIIHLRIIIILCK